MKLSHPSPTTSAGNTLMATLVITALIGLTLASYLNLVGTEQQLTTRSQVWNSSMPVVEAGIEDALSHLYSDYVTNMTGNGWELANSQYVKTNAVIGCDSSGDFPLVVPVNPPATPAKPTWGLAVLNGYYAVQISSNLPYTITSRGFFPLPGATPASTSRYLYRTVRVTTQNLGMFMGPFVLSGGLDLNGNNVRTDSYDSRDPNKSTLGKYDLLKASDKGDVISLSGIDDKIGIGNANVWGHLYTTPTAPVKVGPNGKVGSVSWQAGSTNGIQPGWWQTDLNISFPEVSPPYSAATPPGPNPSYPLFDYVLGTGNYMAPSIGKRVLVTGNATLYVTGDIKFTGSDFIQIAPGASLKIYGAGANALFGDIINPNTDPLSFMYLGLPSNTVLDVKGSAQFYGLIYAPQADVKISGSAEVYGSIVAKTATLTGNAAVHYDEALINQTPTRGFIVASWNEI